jgi:hypothetical protein
MRCSESPPPLPPHFVSFVWRYPGRIRVSFPRPPDASARGLELVTRYLPPGHCREDGGPPRFLGDLRERALLSDPGGIACARPWRRRDAAFRHFHNVGSRELTLSGLNHTARSLAVYASQPGSPRHHARLAPGCWPALPDGAGYPQGPDERFPLSLPPFPSFPGAPTPRLYFVSGRLALGSLGLTPDSGTSLGFPFPIVVYSLAIRRAQSYCGSSSILRSQCDLDT